MSLFTILVKPDSQGFCFKSTVVLRSFLYIFLFRYPQRKKLQALRSGDLASHSLFPLREIAQGGNVSWRTRNVSHCIILVKPDALGFNIKSPQLRFQKICIMSQCSGLNLLLLPCQPCFQRNWDRLPPKDATPHQTITFSEYKVFC